MCLLVRAFGGIRNSLKMDERKRNIFDLLSIKNLSRQRAEDQIRSLFDQELMYGFFDCALPRDLCMVMGQYGSIIANQWVNMGQ